MITEDQFEQLAIQRLQDPSDPDPVRRADERG